MIFFSRVPRSHTVTCTRSVLKIASTLHTPPSCSRLWCFSGFFHWQLKLSRRPLQLSMSKRRWHVQMMQIYRNFNNSTICRHLNYIKACNLLSFFTFADIVKRCSNKHASKSTKNKPKPAGNVYLRLVFVECFGNLSCDHKDVKRQHFWSVHLELRRRLCNFPIRFDCAIKIFASAHDWHEFMNSAWARASQFFAVGLRNAMLSFAVAIYLHVPSH